VRYFVYASNATPPPIPTIVCELLVQALSNAVKAHDEAEAAVAAAGVDAKDSAKAADKATKAAAKAQHELETLDAKHQKVCRRALRRAYERRGVNGVGMGGRQSVFQSLMHVSHIFSIGFEISTND
jgi:hypothetical protein